MKNLANIISFSRILLALCLLFFLNNKIVYLIIFTVAILTDAIDGSIARKTNSESELGAALDDYGDITLALVNIISVFIWLKSKALVFVPFVVVLVILKVANAVILKVKFKKVTILHTFGAKITFVLLFFAIFVFLLFESTILIYITYSIAILTAIEEAIIHLTSSTYDANRKSIFIKEKIKNNSQDSVD